jgi:hypothetical protein
LIFLRFKRSLRDGHLKYSRLHYEYTMRAYWKPTRHCADRHGKQPVPSRVVRLARRDVRWLKSALRCLRQARAAMRERSETTPSGEN